MTIQEITMIADALKELKIKIEKAFEEVEEIINKIS